MWSFGPQNIEIFMKISQNLHGTKIFFQRKNFNVSYFLFPSTSWETLRSKFLKVRFFLWDFLFFSLNNIMCFVQERHLFVPVSKSYWNERRPYQFCKFVSWKWPKFVSFKTAFVPENKNVQALAKFPKKGRNQNEAIIFRDACEWWLIHRQIWIKLFAYNSIEAKPLLE